VGIVKLDELLVGQLLALLEVLDQPADQLPSPSQGLKVTLLLDLDQVEDVLAILLQLREYVLEVVDLPSHRLR